VSLRVLNNSESIDALKRKAMLSMDSVDIDGHE